MVYSSRASSRRSLPTRRKSRRRLKRRWPHSNTKRHGTAVILKVSHFSWRRNVCCATVVRPSFLMPILSLQHVTKDYFTDDQPVRALNNLSLEVSRGEFVVLVGRSGCGKSTLLSLAGAMDFPPSGTGLVDGVATTSLRDDALAKVRREKIGFIFQSRSEE